MSLTSIQYNFSSFSLMSLCCVSCIFSCFRSWQRNIIHTSSEMQHSHMQHLHALLLCKWQKNHPIGRINGCASKTFINIIYSWLSVPVLNLQGCFSTGENCVKRSRIFQRQWIRTVQFNNVITSTLRDWRDKIADTSPHSDFHNNLFHSQGSVTRGCFMHAVPGTRELLNRITYRRITVSCGGVSITIY